MYHEGVTCSVLAQPWSSTMSSSCHVMSYKGNNTMTTKQEDNMKVALMGSFTCEYNENTIGSHHSINEDFFIEDLSEFSNEDIAAPIQGDYIHSPLQQQCDDNSASTIKSDSTTTDHNSSASVLLQDSTAMDYRSALHNEFKDSSSLSLPCQDETGFEWLTPLGDDNLIYGASNFGMDSFLLSNAEPFSDYDGMMKDTDYEDAIKVKDINMGQISLSATSTHEYKQHAKDDRMWENDVNGLKSSCDATFFAPLATGSRSARSKRVRSSGWSSSSILCDNWPERTSPTNSLNSTSQIVLPTPQYSSTPSFMCKQEAGYTTNSHQNLDININSRLTSNPSSDKSLCDLSKSSKFGSNEEWAKEEDYTREESVGTGLQARRCTHCLSQKTPQWRAGPEGPKSLCNACGVRYKSGRLFDEYRPAKSPTFLSYKHSNSHKKVMEMRRRKAYQYNHQQRQHVTHHVRAPPPKHADAVNQHLISKLKVKLSNPANSEPPSISTHFSDITLISTTRNAIDSPSSFLYN